MTDQRSLCDTPDAAVDELVRLYDDAVEWIRGQYQVYVEGQEPAALLEKGVYPRLTVEIPAHRSTRTSSLSLGQVASTNEHTTTVTRPALFRNYLTRQLALVQEEFGARIFVGPSDEPIPLQFALDPHHTPGGLSEATREGIERYFPTPNLVEVNDQIIDGGRILRRDGPLPLSWFPGSRIDYSLYRLEHYTATHPSHFQRFVLFTNYQRYVDEFIAHGHAEVAAGRARALIEPAGSPQMPAYHLVRDDHMGDTLVNIGVGPSNAKTITDHIAVLRPFSWLMIGHCGGLRRTQQLGDYVLAHAYLRDDRVLDDVLPPDVPLPTLAEIQIALTAAVAEETESSAQELKSFLRTGTVVTTNDRNWELSFDRIAERLNRSRAIAIDMESATISANGYRYRVPYGTLLCVSDRPLHGELKLPGMANEFYQRRVSQHLAIALRANEILRAEAVKGALRSRKLRSFDDPLFH